MSIVLEAVKELGGEAFAPQVLTYLNEADADRTDLKTIKSITSTLGYIAKTGLATKEKAAFGEKLLTKFKIEAIAE